MKDLRQLRARQKGGKYLMNEKYITVFKQMCQTVSILAEQVMDYNKKNNNDKGYETAEKMRNMYMALEDKFVNGDELSRVDFVQLITVSYIVMNNIQTRIENEQKALEGYKVDLLPKLSRIMNETSDDESARKLAEELFSI